ncbi:hypothetical protein EDC38_0709 [Marinimicrobium koreense]|uniref:DUF3108 domain-containing protein n=1 Tax=Marinimicrobium koreense TaxID=306545 RepID=A0A3N1NVC2_9GAMM|nr:hypothetical protein [Marinimicrobium koreense]ROQ20113.1 hypothetical protein EDC38_0709 [Marinimicrobium koreense]
MWKSLISGVAASLLLLPTAQALAEESEYEIIGAAYHADKIEQLLYEERYTPVNDSGKGEVHYVDPDGERIAEKTLDYSHGETSPSFELRDLRQDLHWSARWSDDEEQIRLTRGSREEPESESVEVKSRQVIDAGFDPFIQSHWDRLMDGERVTFHFAFPNRLTNVRLRAERIEADDSPIQKQEEGWVYFRIRVNSAVLSLFADNLYLAYDPEDTRLMVFRGRSNIPDADGEGRDVEIHYRYP